MSTTVYFTNTAASVGTGLPKIATIDGTKGAGLTVSTTNTINSAGGVLVQCTNSAGGTLIEWWTPSLNALTWSAGFSTNIWQAESNMSANAQEALIVEVWDSTGTTLRGQAWSASSGQPIVSTSEMPVTTRAAQTGASSGLAGATNITQGDRLRILLGGAGTPGNNMSSGFTFTTGYGGTTGGSDGDTFMTFTDTLTAAPTARTPRNPAVNFQNPGVLFKRFWNGWSRRESGVLVPC